MYFIDLGFRNRLARDFRNRDPRPDVGPLMENFVASKLTKKGNKLRLWRTKSGAEVDFVLETGEGPLPLEVKAGTTRVPQFHKEVSAGGGLCVPHRERPRDEGRGDRGALPVPIRPAVDGLVALKPHPVSWDSAVNKALEQEEGIGGLTVVLVCKKAVCRTQLKYMQSDGS